MLKRDEAGEFAGNDRFAVVRRLGRGGMGVVYEAWDRERESSVALKTLRTWSADALLRLKTEFRALQDLQHPNLVRLGELFQEEGQWFFTMELVDGVPFLAWVRPGDEEDSASRADTAGGEESTLELIARRGPGGRGPGSRYHVDEVRLRAALRQLAQGVFALHAARKIHRDIKPSNVLVTPSGRVVILDFGLITDTGGRPWDEGRLVGTASFMAPEQAASRQVTPAADWYSVGVMLYQALTGALPFQAKPDAVLLMKQAMVPLPPSSLAAEVPGDLNRLCVDLLQIDPERRPSGQQILERLRAEDAALAAGLPPQSAHFIGRQSELEILRGALGRSRGGRAVTLLVDGDSGVGKSALMRRFTERLADHEQGAVILLGRCYEREAVPYKGIDGVVDALARHLASLEVTEQGQLLPPEAPLLAQVFPVMRRVELLARRSRPLIEHLDPQEVRTRLFGALRELLRRLAERAPLVVAIDDLQWADPDSLAALAEVLRAPGEPSLLLLATLNRSVDVDGESRVAALAARLGHEVERLPLGNLGPKEAATLAAVLVAEGGGQTLDSATIAEETAGHPLFIDELVRHRLLTPTGSHVRLDEAVWSRVDTLAPGSRRLLELVAVAGVPIAQEVLALALHRDFAGLADEVAALRHAHLVKTTGARRLDTVEPYHYRVRRALLDRLAAEAVRSGHEHLAVALEGRADADPEALAVHWRDAGAPDKSAYYARRAAEQADRALAFDRAARLYRWVLEVEQQTEDRGALLVKLGDALANAGRGDEAAAAYLEALPTGSPALDLDVQRRAAEQLLRSGHIDRGLAVLRELLAALGTSLPETPQRALASLLYRRARLRLRGLDFKERHESEIAETERTRIDTFWSVAGGLAIVDTIRGADFQTRGLLQALEAGEPYRVARALAAEVGFTAAAGGPAQRRTRRLLAAAEALAARVDHPHARAMPVAAAGMAAFLEGRFRDALALLDRARELFLACTNVAWELHTAHLYSLISLVYLGETAELARRYPVRLAEAIERGNLYAATALRTALPSLVWLVDDRPDQLRHELGEAARTWSRSGFHLEHYWILLAECQADLYEGDAVTAAQRLATRWAALERSLLLRIQVVQLEALHLRGRVALAEAEAGGDRRALLERAERDGRAIESAAMPWGTPLGRLLRAACAHLRGDERTALRLLDQAAQGFALADMGLFSACARFRLGQLQGAEGAGEQARAVAWMEQQSVRRPERMVALLAPGFGESGAASPAP